MCSGVGCVCLRTRLGRSSAGLLGSRSLRREFGDLRIPVVEFGIKYADFPQVAPLKCGEFGAQVGKRQFAVSEFGLQDGQLLPLPGKFLLFRRQMADNFCRHMLAAILSPSWRAAHI